MIRQLVDAICFRLIHGPLGGTPAFQIEKLHLNPGDQIVVKYDGLLSADDAKRIRETLAPHVPLGMHFMVIDKTVDLAVIARSAEVRSAA